MLVRNCLSSRVAAIGCSATALMVEVFQFLVGVPKCVNHGSVAWYLVNNVAGDRETTLLVVRS